MRRFEVKQGNSSKFWEVEVAGAEMIVRFGRIGTAGQRKAKTCSNAAGAAKERDQLIKEKLDKGYSEVKPGAIAPTSSPRATAVQAPAAKPTPPLDAIRWPDGGVQWCSAWNDRLPIVRGIHAPPPDEDLEW